MTDHVGQRIGKYDLLRLLGEGGFAKVYLGKHVDLGSEAAIKILLAQVPQANVTQLRQEGRTLANLIHPHIVRVFDFDIFKGMPYLVMDYAPGGTLYELHPKGSRLSLSAILLYIKQIAQAIQYAHNQGVIHRDIKPGNMLIGRRSEVLLSDFGIALIVQHTRPLSTKEPFGTVRYMAPEALKGHPCFASDQYSLGVVIYEWLAGKPPFEGIPIDVAMHHIHTPPPPLHTLLPTISPEVERVVMKALAKEPGDRFSSIDKFAMALEQASGIASSGQSKPGVKPSRTNNQPSPNNPVQPPPASSKTAVIHEPPQGTLLKPYTQHSKKVTSLSWSSDGVSIASASDDKTVHIWNTRNGKRQFIYQSHTDSVNCVAWLPDSQRIATASADGKAHVWNAHNGDQYFPPYEYHNGIVTSVAWSPDKSRIASASHDKTVQIWSATNGRRMVICSGHSAAIWSIAWSADSKRLASASYDNRVQVWNAANGNHLFSYDRHTGCVWSVAWSPDGLRVASASHDKTVQVWSAAYRHRHYTYKGHTETVHSVAWSPNGHYIASGSTDGTVHVFKALDGTPLFIYRGHTTTVTAVAWSPDSRRIASASKNGVIHIWQAM